MRSFAKARHCDAFLDRLATMRAAGTPITAETLTRYNVVGSDALRAATDAANRSR